jgi:hypothetical protein
VQGLYDRLAQRYGITPNSGGDLDQAFKADAGLQDRANLAKTGEVMMASMQRRAPNLAQLNVEPVNLKQALLKRQMADQDLARQVSMPLDVAGKVAGIGKTQAETTLAGAQAANIPQKLAQDLDQLKLQLASAERLGFSAQANQLKIAIYNKQAEIEARKFGIAAGNPEDADWDIGPQYREGEKTLPDAARDVLKRSPGARALLDASARAEEIITRHPTGVSVGNDAADLKRWLDEMHAQLNNVWGMGILKQANMPMMEEALADPTNFVARIKTGLKGQEFLHQFHQFQTMVKQRMVSEAGAVGLSPKRGGYYEGFQGVSGKTVADAPPVPGAVRMKSGQWAVKNASGQYEYVE